MQKPSLPKGTRDFGPEQSVKRKFILDTIERAFHRYGFNKIETPSLENLSVLTGKYGDEGDQLLFKVLNSGDFLSKTTLEDFNSGSQNVLPKISEKGLRYDLTVPFARYVVMNQHQLSFPFKRYQMQPVWRADRPQKGRYREFYQCDADVIGTTSLWAETELIQLINDVFSDLGLQEYVLKLNHREILFAFAEVAGVPEKTSEFCTILDKLDKIESAEVEKQLVELGAVEEKVNHLLKVIESPLDFNQTLKVLQEIIPSNNKGLKDLAELQELAIDIENRKVMLDPGLARGLSYYTGLIYEVKPTSVKMGSICGGGRYDNLTGIFGLPNVSGVGISFGLDRIYDVLEELGLFSQQKLNVIDLYITHFDSESFAYGRKLVTKLRNAGIKVDIYPEPVKIKKQFTHANRLGVPFVITIGDDEMKTGLLPLKNMQSGETMKKNVDEILDQFSSRD